jgi:hypothetical protein
MTDFPLSGKWKLGQYVRVWKNEGYEYGHIETIEDVDDFASPAPQEIEVMLVGDDGREIFARVKDLEEG